MNTTHVKYLLLGGGLASSAAAVAIRERDREGDMLLVGQEINRPYRRAPLSGDYLAKRATHEDLFTLPADWFTANNVRLRTGRRASHIDAARMSVALDDGSSVSYDKLLIATGATPARLAVPGAELPGVYSLRTFEGAHRLQTAIDKARAEGRKHDQGRGRAIVVGAGWAGVELAATLTSLGMGVDLTTSLPHPWGRFAGSTTAGYVTRLLESRGVRVHSANTVVGLDGDGRVQRAALADGTRIDCDFAVVAMGVTPNRDLLRGSSIAAERAVLVDEHGRTNIPNIYAAGDCAAVLDPLYGKHRLSDHWDSAVPTGTIAGRNMAGDDTRFTDVSTFTTQVFDVPVTVYGEPRFVDHRLVRGQPGADEGFAEIGVAAEGRVSQVLCVGQDVAGVRELVLNRTNVTGREESLKDPTVAIG